MRPDDPLQAGTGTRLFFPTVPSGRMVSALTAAYSVVVLLVALAGTAFVFALPGDDDGGSSWSRWGNFAAIAIFLLAMVGLLLA